MTPFFFFFLPSAFTIYLQACKLLRSLQWGAGGGPNSEPWPEGRVESGLYGFQGWALGAVLLLKWGRLWHLGCWVETQLVPRGPGAFQRVPKYQRVWRSLLAGLALRALRKQRAGGVWEGGGDRKEMGKKGKASSEPWETTAQAGISTSTIWQRV